MDWNGNGIFEGVSQCGLIFHNIPADLNNDGVCVSAGPNGTLDTKETGDDMERDNGIDDGKNRFCNTAAKAGSDDQQVTAVGDTPPQPDLLKSFDDWGRHFTVSNSNHVQEETIAARYLKRNPDLPVRSAIEDISDHEPAAKVYSIVEHPRFEMLSGVGQFTSACGITYYRGSS